VSDTPTTRDDEALIALARAVADGTEGWPPACELRDRIAARLTPPVEGGRSDEELLDEFEEATRACVPLDADDYPTVEQQQRLERAAAALRARLTSSSSTPDSKLREAAQAMLDTYVELMESGDCGFSDPNHAPAVAALRAALSTPERDEVGSDTAFLAFIREHCRVVYYPPKDHPIGDYPIEHAPHARKDSWMWIEAEFKRSLRAPSQEDGDGR
jgi:hypothetical protein